MRRVVAIFGGALTAVGGLELDVSHHLIFAARRDTDNSQSRQMATRISDSLWEV